MGRFYKTTSDTPLDYMYHLNTPLMERVVAKNDQYITDNLTQAGKVETAATSFNFLTPDEQRSKEIADQYSGKIDDITKAILADPAKWRNHTTDIADITRDLQSNMKTGEIAKITGNYGKYKTVSDYIDKATEEYAKTGKGISADRGRAYKNYFLSTLADGTKYNPKTGEYNAINTYDPMSNIDIKTKLAEGLDKLKADKKNFYHDESTNQDWYFNKTTEKWEGVSPKRVLEIVTDRLNDPQLMDYMRQDSQVGLMNNVFDKNTGGMIKPYDYVDVPLSKEETTQIENMKHIIASEKHPDRKQALQAQMDTYVDNLNSRKSLEWNDQSFLSPIMRGLVNQFSYGQTESGNTLRNNSKGQTRFVQGQENYRNSANISSRERINAENEKGRNDRAKATLDQRKWEFDNPHQKGKTGPGSTKVGTGTTGLPGQTFESTVSNIATRSFEDWTTTANSGKTVQVLTNEGLSSEIDQQKKKLDDTNTNLKKFDYQMKSILGNRKPKDLNPTELNLYNQALVQRQALQNQIPKIQSYLGQIRDWYTTSVNAALTNNNAALTNAKGDPVTALTPDEIAIYKNGEEQIDLAKKQAAELQKQYMALGFNNNKERNEKAEALINKAAALGYEIKYKNLVELPTNPVKDNYWRVKKKVDNMRDNFLTAVRGKYITSNAVEVGIEDNKVLAPMVFNDLQSINFFGDKGQKLSAVEVNGKKIPVNVNNSMELSNLFKSNLVTPVITQVGNTTKIGNGGAIAKVSFKNADGSISQPIYIELTSEMQRDVAKKLSISTNPEVVKVANQINDDVANNIRRQLINPSARMVAGVTNDYDQPFLVTVRNGNQDVSLQIKKYLGVNGQENLSVSRMKDGVAIPLGSDNPMFLPPSKIPGMFNGSEELVDYLTKPKN